jgi:hypothetical protein
MTDRVDLQMGKGSDTLGSQVALLELSFVINFVTE